jgi:outer membrane protein TolC
LLVQTELAFHYLQWQGARVRQQQLQSLIDAQHHQVLLTERRWVEGLGTALDVDAVQAERAVLLAQAPSLVLLQQHSEHRMAVLLGRTASQALPELQTAALALPQVPAFAPGQPADLLLRRPDLLAASAKAVSDAAKADERAADRWPKLYLAALLGRQDLRLNGLDLAPVGFQNVALAFTAPLFNAGRLQAQADAARAQSQASELAQQHAWLTALQEVESALAALEASRLRQTEQAQQVQARERLHAHAGRLFAQGLSGRGPLLNAQRGLYAAQLEWSQARLNTALDAVQLAKALGGGWALEELP